MRPKYILALCSGLFWIPSGFAATGNGAPEFNGLNTLWILLAAFLVFFMQAGFGMVEAGMVRAKNACNRRL